MCGQKADQWLPGHGGGVVWRGRDDKKRTSGVMDMCTVLTVVKISQGNVYLCQTY